MKIVNLVTVTGADDSTPVNDLIAVAQEFPFVEFGILLSRNAMGGRRFPSSEWLNTLIETVRSQNLNLNLCGHLCGAWVRELLKGKWPEPELQSLHPSFTYAKIFKRWQINTHAMRHKIDVPAVLKILDMLAHREQSAIFQYDEVNTDILFKARDAGCRNIATLFDLSHGAGTLPEKWPAPIPGVYCGYAGGLSPDNVAAQLEKIESSVGHTAATIWIDAETHLRTPDDAVFDLGKVRKFLAAAQPWCVDGQ